MTRVGLFRIVPYPALTDFLQRGWMFIEHLGPYSCLCWHCECEAAR